jgi:hypothetical protein
LDPRIVYVYPETHLRVVVAAGAITADIEVLPYKLHTAAAALEARLRQVTFCVVAE